MSEINKLRARLRNVQRNVTEYRMTVAEAKELLSEIDNLAIPVVKVVSAPIVVEPPTVRIIDGGTF